MADRAKRAVSQKTEPIIGTVPDGRVVLKENRIMMVSDETGDIPAGNSKGLGLYYQDTRFLSAYEFRLNRLQPILLSARSAAARRHLVGRHVR